MPSSKLLKERIESIQDTMKITNAMYLISSSKLRKHVRTTRMYSPYFNRMRDTIFPRGTPTCRKSRYIRSSTNATSQTPSALTSC